MEREIPGALSRDHFQWNAQLQISISRVDFCIVRIAAFLCENNRVGVTGPEGNDIGQHADVDRCVRST